MGPSIQGRTLTSAHEMGLTRWIYPRGKHMNFLFFAQFFFANSKFIFAIKDPKLVRRGLEYTLEIAQYRGLFFTFTPRKPKHYLVGPRSWSQFSVLPVVTS